MSDESEKIEESEEVADVSTDIPAGNVVASPTDFDFEHLKMLTLYATGMPVAEIVGRMGYTSPGTVYNKMKEFPAEYAAAKRKLVESRVAKYRRIGALASDILVDSLEKMKILLADEEEIKSRMLVLKTDDPEFEILKLQLKEISDIRADLKTISTVAESAERRADLGEGNPTERTEHGASVGLVALLSSLGDR